MNKHNEIIAGEFCRVSDFLNSAREAVISIENKLISAKDISSTDGVSMDVGEFNQATLNAIELMSKTYHTAISKLTYDSKVNTITSMREAVEGMSNLSVMQSVGSLLNDDITHYVNLDSLEIIDREYSGTGMELCIFKVSTSGAKPTLSFEGKPNKLVIPCSSLREAKLVIKAHIEQLIDEDNLSEFDIKNFEYAAYEYMIKLSEKHVDRMKEIGAEIKAEKVKEIKSGIKYQMEKLENLKKKLKKLGTIEKEPTPGCEGVRNGDAICLRGTCGPCTENENE